MGRQKAAEAHQMQVQLYLQLILHNLKKHAAFAHQNLSIQTPTCLQKPKRNRMDGRLAYDPHIESEASHRWFESIKDLINLWADWSYPS